MIERDEAAPMINGCGVPTGRLQARGGALRSRRLRRIVVALAVCIPCVGWAAPTNTLAYRSIAISVPNDCLLDETFESDNAARCLSTRQGAPGFSVRLDQVLKLSATPGRTPDQQVGIAIAMDDGFNEFLGYSISGSHNHKISAAPVPASRLPRGLSHCKSYTLEMRNTVDAGILDTRELGIYCADWSDDENGIVVTIASVVYFWLPSRGQRLPSDFDTQALRILNTLRAR